MSGLLIGNLGGSFTQIRREGRNRLKECGYWIQFFFLIFYFNFLLFSYSCAADKVLIKMSMFRRITGCMNE